MRVCLVSFEYPPSGGGEASYVASLAAGLSGLGHEVVVVVPAAPSLVRPAAPFRVVTTRARRGATRELAFIAEAQSVVREMARRRLIDVVHVTFDYPTFFFRLRDLGVPCVSTVHHLHLAEALAMMKHEGSRAKKIAGLGRSSLLTSLEANLVRQCSRVIAVSEFTASTVRDLVRIDPAKLRLVRNGIETGQFQKAEPERFRSSFPGLGQEIILYVGRLERSKGLHHLVPAFAKVARSCPSASLAIVGGGDPGYANALKSIAKDAGVSSRVTFTGRIPQELLKDAYAACSLVVLPSLMEGFGISILESMASRRACVATRVGAVPEIVRDGQTGLLVGPADPGALADAISTLLADEPRRRSMGEKGFGLVSSTFTAENMCAKTMEVYRESLET